MASHNHQILSRNIIELSKAKTWEDAKMEWSVSYVFWDEDGTSCLCSHSPIKECCALVNSENGKNTTVGNVCVNKFLGKDFTGEFAMLRSLRENPTTKMRWALVQYAFDRKWIKKKDYDFYRDHYEYKWPTALQLAWRRDVNNRVLGHMTRSSVAVS
jgi:hypothetical protein